MITLVRYILYYMLFSILAFCGAVLLWGIATIESHFLHRMYFVEKYPHD